METRTYEPVETLRLSKRMRLSDLSPRTAAWLALAPSWPARVAVRGFPVSESGLATGEAVTLVLDRAANAGLITSRNSIYSMNPLQCAEAIRWLTASGGEFEQIRSPRWTRDELLQELSAAGKQMHIASAELSREPETGKQEDSGPRSGRFTLPPALARWEDLADQPSLGEMVAFLLKAVRSEIEASERAGLTSCPGAARWIETAQKLAAIFEPLEMAVADAERQKELFNRNSRDEQSLQNYQRRKGAENALRKLVEGPDSQWAMHYLGVGGSGKTMIVRNIQVRLAKDLNLLTARVDFDSFSPDFPLRAPGLLLMALAKELALRMGQELKARLGRFRTAMENVHRQLEGALAEGLDAQAGLEAKGFQEAMDSFAETLGALPPGVHPVLILDTCEELVRLRPEGTLPGNVEATFKILENLHNEKLPRLRVVFSGRRPLAHAGAGWVCEGSKLPDRPYLSIYRIQGFNLEEAEGFLKNYHRDGKPVPPDFYDTILKRSCSAQSPEFEEIRVEHEDPEDSEAPRYNPYDLNLYASWAATDSTLTVPKLEAASVHLYVKERIIGRVHPVVQPIVPLLTALERFDRALVQTTARLDDDHAAVVWEEIRGVEWAEVDRQAISVAEAQVIDPNLLIRLRAYFADEQPAVWEEAKRRTRVVLLEATSERNFRDLTPSYFGVLLRLHDLESAAAWLPEVERKIANAKQWNWLSPLANELENQIERLCKDKPDDGWERLRPGVLALSAAGKLRDRSGGVLLTWQQVLETAEQYPDLRQAEILKYRAAAGRFAQFRWSPEAPKESDAETLEKMWLEVPPLDVLGGDPELLAAEIALLENCVEVLERIDWRQTSLASRLISSWTYRTCRAFEQHLAKQECPPLWPHFVRVLGARVQALSGEMPNREEYREFVDFRFASTPLQDFLDWRGPADLCARIHLEWLRILRREVDETLNREEYQSPPENLDEDRLRAIRLQIAADHVSVPIFGLGDPAGLFPSIRPDAVQRLDVSDALARERSRTPACEAHPTLPPLSIVALQEEAISGNVDEAYRLLQQIASDTTLSEHIIRWAERALWRTIQRMRLLDVIPEPQTLLAQSSSVADRMLLEGALAFKAQRPQPYEGRWKEISDPLPYEWLQAQLDIQEPTPDKRALTAMELQIRNWCDRNPLDDDGVVSLLGRWEALASTEISLRATHWKRAAEILLEEGALTGLRNGDAGLRLLHAAAILFDRAGAPIGELIAQINLACLDWQNLQPLTDAVATYQRLRAVRPELRLPDWNGRTLPEKLESIGQAPIVWRPWLTRLVAVEVWQRSPRIRSGQVEQFIEWLRGGYASFPALPPDFPLPAWVVKHLAATASGAKEGGNRRWARVVSFAIPAAVLIGVFLGFRWGLRKLDPDVGWANSIVAFFLFLVALGGLIYTVQRARIIGNWLSNALLFAACLKIRIQIAPAPESRPDPSRPWESAWEFQAVYTFYRYLQFKFLPAMRVEGAQQTDYRQQSIQFGGRLSPSLGRRVPLELPEIRRSLYESMRMRLDLEVPREGAAMCWEAVFGQMGGAFEHLKQSGMLFRRVAPNSAEARTLPPVPENAGVRYLGRRLNPWAGRLPDRFSGWRLESWIEPDPTCVILHLRGDIVESAGVLYFIEWAGYEDIPDSMPGSAGSWPGHTNLESPVTATQYKLETVPQLCPAVRLLVLECPPLVETVRLEKDRQRASLFRRAADYLFSSGIAAVVVLPPMTDTISGRAVSEIAKAMQRKRPAEELRKALREIQLAIDQESGLDGDAAREFAYDACFYSTDEVALS
jgi:hypothetical protein